MIFSIFELQNMFVGRNIALITLLNDFDSTVTWSSGTVETIVLFLGNAALLNASSRFYKRFADILVFDKYILLLMFILSNLISGNGASQVLIFLKQSGRKLIFDGSKVGIMLLVLFFLYGFIIFLLIGLNAGLKSLLILNAGLGVGMLS